MSIIRTRWAAIGAAIAVTLGAGGIGIVSATQPDAAVTFVPITPCRVMDTRIEFNVGPKTSPLGPDEVYTVNTTNADTGNCTGIPTTATGVSLNVTALDATLPTFLTIWATGAPRPDASSLNPVPDQPATPNAVTTGINQDGQFDIYNLQGNVQVVADINGYYTDHHHDDRYYTKNQVDSKVGEVESKVGEVEANLGPRGYGRVRVVGIIPDTIYWDMAFDGDHPGFISARTPGGGVTCLLPDPAVLAPVDVAGGFLQDASGNDTRLYFNGSFGCDDDEVRVVQKLNVNESPSNQPFNVMVP